MSIASNYNSRGRAAEVLVDGKRAKLVRRRETIEDQLRGEGKLLTRRAIAKVKEETRIMRASANVCLDCFYCEIECTEASVPASAGSGEGAV